MHICKYYASCFATAIIYEHAFLDFLAGLFHHAAHAVLGVAAHAVNGITRILGDENQKGVLESLCLIKHCCFVALITLCAKSF